jgi:hypothetical protein
MRCEIASGGTPVECDAKLPLAARQKKGCVTVVTQPIFLIQPYICRFRPNYLAA